MESSGLASLDNLTHLASRRGADMRPTLLRVLTDLYVQKLTHTPDEERHYTELALRLLDAVDAATRAAVAERLTSHLSPPPLVIARLAAGLTDVAAPPALDAPLQPADSASAPAPSVTSAGAVATPGNRGDYNSPAAESTDAMGAELAHELNELFFAANANERRLILLNLEVVAPSPPGHTSVTRDDAVGQRLETAALARNREDFARQLAQALRIPQTQARRIAGDGLGEAIIVAAKALNLRRDVVCRILLFVNTAVGHSVERVHALAALYDELPRQAAEHLVGMWQALEKDDRGVGRHRPLLWNDETRTRARPASVSAQQPPVAPGSSGRREVS
jgi:uncharacterized protein (DUF2336 family)